MTAAQAVLIVASGLGTAVGALGLLAVRRRPGERALAAMLGFTGGVMLAAAAFSLLVPSFERGNVVEVIAGFLVGAAFVALLDKRLPHAHVEAEPEHPALEEVEARRRAKLLLLAMTIHNVPEGLSVGFAFAVGGPETGVPVAIAIGLQNVPEGFVAGVPLIRSRVPRRRAALIAGSTGLVEPVAAFLAFGAASLTGLLLAGALAFAAGAMVYVVIDELLPEAVGGRQARTATLAFIGGFALMMGLDNAFG